MLFTAMRINPTGPDVVGPWWGQFLPRGLCCSPTPNTHPALRRGLGSYSFFKSVSECPLLGETLPDHPIDRALLAFGSLSATLLFRFVFIAVVALK